MTKLIFELTGTALQVKKEQKELDRAFGSGPQLVPGKGMTDPEGKRMVSPTRACTQTNIHTACRELTSPKQGSGLYSQSGTASLLSQRVHKQLHSVQRSQ